MDLNKKEKLQQYYKQYYINNKQKICITGSNGKTTTTLLIYHILKKAGYHVGLAGNIGKSFAYQVATENFDYYVLELSSFQLDGMYDFKADVAVLLNITPDHLDMDMNEIIYIALSYIGVNLKDPDVSQFAQLKTQTGL